MPSINSTFLLYGRKISCIKESAKTKEPSPCLLFMNGDKISTILEEHPEMGLYEIKRVQDILDDPVLVIKSNGSNRHGQNTRVVVFGSFQAKNGQPIMSILDLRPVDGGFVIADMQKVNSAYTRDNALNYIQSGEILHADKKRAIPLLRSIGLHGPIELQQSGSIGSISYKQRSVNIQGVPFAEVVRVGKPKGKFSQERRGQVTEEEIAAVQSIGRKSVNELTSEELKAVEPFARRYLQELGEKSPFFRAWFGDWRANDQTPVQIATQQGDARGAQVNEDTGWDIQVSRQVFNETKIHQSMASQTAQPYLPFINDIVKKAVLLDSYTLGKAKSPNSVMMHSLYAVADIGNGPEVLKLYVEEMNDPNQADTAKRAYQLQNIERQQSGVKGSGGSPSLIAQTADIKSVADLFRAVKARDKAFSPRAASKVVDAEGKPLVVYHGTGADFSAFDVRRQGQNFLGQGAHGFFFTTKRKTAENYAKLADGDRVIEAYLSMRAPYEITSPKEIDPIQYWDRDAEIMHEVWRRQDDAIWESSDGCDGVIIHGEKSDLYVVFDPEQIKSATDNIGTFDGTNPDIRFSQEPGTYVQELRELERENKRLKKRLDQVMGEFRLSGGPTVDRGAVQGEARRLIQSMGVKGMTIDEVAERLQDIYDLISTGRKGGNELSYGAVKEMAEDLARDVLSHAVEKDDSAYQEYSALRAYFKDTQLVISEADSRDIPDYGD